MGVLDTLSDVFSSEERGATRYYCEGCERTFAYRADFDDPDCPYCVSQPLEPLDERR